MDVESATRTREWHVCCIVVTFSSRIGKLKTYSVRDQPYTKHVRRPWFGTSMVPSHEGYRICTSNLMLSDATCDFEMRPLPGAYQKSLPLQRRVLHDNQALKYLSLIQTRGIPQKCKRTSLPSIKSASQKEHLSHDLISPDKIPRTPLVLAPDHTLSTHHLPAEQPRSHPARTRRSHTIKVINRKTRKARSAAICAEKMSNLTPKGARSSLRARYDTTKSLELWVCGNADVRIEEWDYISTRLVPPLMNQIKFRTFDLCEFLDPGDWDGLLGSGHSHDRT
jgi:hypothetical protein